MTTGVFESPAVSFPGIPAAAQLGVDKVNASGGINGRPLELITCNDKFDPNEAVACVQRAVDEGVIALVGGMTAYDASTISILEAAHIPYIGPAGADAGAVTSVNTMMYPINGGPYMFQLGVGRAATEAGGKNIAIVYSDNPGSEAGAATVQVGVEAGGGTGTLHSAPEGASDYSAVAAAVVEDKPDAVALTGNPVTISRVIVAIVKAGFDGPMTTYSEILSPSVLEALGENAEGIEVTSRGFPVSNLSNPVVKEFNEAMHAVDPDLTVDESGINAYLSVKVLAAALEGRDVSDGQSVIDALDSIEEPIDLGGVFPDYAGIAEEPPVPDYPRIPSAEIMLSTVTDGELIPNGGFFNPLQ